MPQRSEIQRSEIDLTGFYRFDLKTIAVLLTLAGLWYDNRNQQNQRAAVDEVRQEYNAAALAEQKQLIKLLQADLSLVQRDVAIITGGQQAETGKE